MKNVNSFPTLVTSLQLRNFNSELHLFICPRTGSAKTTTLTDALILGNRRSGQNEALCRRWQTGAAACQRARVDVQINIQKSRWTIVRHKTRHARIGERQWKSTGAVVLRDTSLRAQCYCEPGCVNQPLWIFTVGWVMPRDFTNREWWLKTDREIIILKHARGGTMLDFFSLH